jgi:HEAT repeat protein
MTLNRALVTALLAAACLGGIRPKQAEPAVDAAIERFRKEFRSTSTDARAAAVKELGRTAHVRTLALIAPLLTADLSPVRVAAAEALSGFCGQRRSAATFLTLALGRNRREPEVRAAILASLGRLQERAALPDVLAGLEDPDPAPAAAAAQAVAELGGREAIPALIAALRKAEREEGAGSAVLIPDSDRRVLLEGIDEDRRLRAAALRPALQKALETASGGERLSRADEWDAWWARYGRR